MLLFVIRVKSKQNQNKHEETGFTNGMAEACPHFSRRHNFRKLSFVEI